MLVVVCSFVLPAALKARGAPGVALILALQASSLHSVPWASIQALYQTPPVPSVPVSPRPTEALGESLVEEARREVLGRWDTWEATWEQMTVLRDLAVP